MMTALRLLLLLLVLPAIAPAARDFNGTTQRIDAGNPSLGLSTTYTVSLWVQPDSVASTRTFMKWGATANSAPFVFLFGQVSADIRFFVRDNALTGANATKASVFTAGVWTHCAGVRDGNDVQVYADGVAGTGANAAIGTMTVNSLRIGAADDGSGGIVQHTDGRIAEVAIWSVALTVDEIGSLAKGLSPLHVRPSALVFFAPFVRSIQEQRQPVTLTDSGSTTVADHPRIYR